MSGRDCGQPASLLEQFDITGLTDADIFYFGNAPGETGNSPTNTIVNAINDPYDYNRDGLVNGTDQIIARENQTNPLTMLRLISVPNASKATTVPAELDWLYEFEQISTKRDASKNRTSAEATVDRLMASDWA